MDIEETVWLTLTVHDEPLPAVIVVPAVIPYPDKAIPMVMAPDATDETVSVVEDIDPVKIAEL